MAYEDGSRSWAYSVREHRVSASLVGLAAIIMLLATLLPRGTASAAVSGPPASLFPANGAYFGSWVAPRSGESTQQAIQRVESSGRSEVRDRSSVLQVGHAVPDLGANVDRRQGRIPFINWNRNGTTARPSRGAPSRRVLRMPRSSRVPTPSRRSAIRCTSPSTTSPRTTSQPSAPPLTTPRHSVTSSPSSGHAASPTWPSSGP